MSNNQVLFSCVRDELLEGRSVRVKVQGQSMLPFFQSGSVVLLRPVEESDFRVGAVVLGRTDEGDFVIHRIIGVEAERVLLLGDGNVVREECIPRERIYGAIDCPSWHSPLARVWLWLRPVRGYPLALLRRICRR